MNPLPQLVSAATFCAAFLSVVFTPATLSAADKVDYKAIAERVVGECAGVIPGDRVVVRGDVRDMDLIEEISLAVLRRGAEPLQIVGREEAGRRYFSDVPAQQDTAPLTFSQKLVDSETVEIFFGGTEYPALYNDVDPARLAANYKRFAELAKARLARGVRMVELGNGLYPTEATAKRYGISKDKLAELYWSGINVDYTKLQATGAAVRTALAAGREIRVTHPNGTNLTCRIEGRPVFVSDGVISKEDIAKGGPATQVWLPAGNVYLAPVAGTTEGKIVFTSLPFDDGEILDATFTIKAGKLTAHTARPNAHYERWKALYAAGPATKDQFAFVDLGINPNVKVPAGSKLATWVPAGTVTLGFGGNIWAGGTNEITWDTVGSLNGCTVVVDGKTIVENGVLKTM